MSTAPFSWPADCEGAVSLTFDDAMRSQLELAVPWLTEAGLRGTFYVNPRGENWKERLAPWREVALAGHEVGNHSVDHICSANFAWVTGRTLETTTDEEMDWQIAEGKRRLLELIPEQPETTFCYPCYHEHLGRGAERRSYVPLVARHHPAARGRGEALNHPLHTDPHFLASFSAERMSGAEMVGYAERAATQGRWAIFTFHGIQQGHLSVGEGDFRELVEHLRRHRKRIWTATVLEGARLLQAAAPSGSR